MRTILSHRSIEKYLQKCADERKFSFGLVIGQPTLANKDYIVHLAKNSDYHEGDHDVEQPPITEEENASHYSVKGMEELDDNSLSQQVMSVIKLIPACFYVLGVFFVNDFDIYENETTTDKIKVLIEHLNMIFKSNKYLCGNSKALGNEKLIMFYNSTTKTTNCKYYDPKNMENCIPAENVFLDKQIDWTLFETNYELDEVFPIVDKNDKINIESHFNSTLETINVLIKNSKIFIQDEPIEESIVLDSYMKKNQNKYEKTKPIPVCIFLAATTSDEEQIIIAEYDGLIRYSGIIASRIWINPKSSFKEIYDFIRSDIMRSMASRVQVYCDGLIDPNASDDAIVLNEPPRRVFYNKPDGNGIQFCDYIFRGESPSVVTAQAKFILDLDIEPDNVDDAVEGYPEDDDYFGFSKLSIPLNRQSKIKVREYGQIMYMAGLATAIFVLLISIILHFIFR